jgi:raffinose/stachyose/melibiose transport system permease protein
MGLGAFFGRCRVQVNLLSAAAILVSLPVIVLSFVFRRQFIRGILSGLSHGRGSGLSGAQIPSTA